MIKYYPYEMPAYDSKIAKREYYGEYKKYYRKENNMQDLSDEERINKVKEGVLELLKKYNCSLSMNILSEIDIFTGAKKENYLLVIVPLKEQKEEIKDGKES